MTKTAYKLFRITKDNRITSLFIDKTRNLPYGMWINSENHPTKGFAERPGWHCTAEPVAPHLKMKLKSGEVRVWREVLIEDYEEIQRPSNQGGLWFLAKRMMIVDDDITKEELEMFCNQLKHMAGEAKTAAGNFDEINFPAIRLAFAKPIIKKFKNRDEDIREGLLECIKRIHRKQSYRSE